MRRKRSRMLTIEHEREQKSEELLFLLLVEYEERIAQSSKANARSIASGNSSKFMEEMSIALETLFRKCLTLGAYRATGDEKLLDESSSARGSVEFATAQGMMQTQRPYLLGFAYAIETQQFGAVSKGEKIDAILSKIQRRAWLYTGKAIASANMAWALSMPFDTLFYWRLSPVEEHCEDCPALALGSPYTKVQLPTFPRMGETECLMNCLCWLETETGLRSFTGEFPNG